MACCDNCAKTGGSCGEKPEHSTALGHPAQHALGDIVTTTTSGTTTPWGTILAVAAGGVVLGAFAMKFYGKPRRRRRMNPAHDAFVGRQVDVRSSGNVWRGTVQSSSGSMITVADRAGHMRRVRKDSVQLV